MRADDLADVVRIARVARDDSVDLFDVVHRLAHFLLRQPRFVTTREMLHGVARHRQCVLVVVGELIGDAGDARVHVAAAERFRVDDFAGRRAHQRRAAEEDRALFLDDDRFVAHCRHVSAAGGARSHHHRELRYAGRREARLVVEDAAEVIAVREDLVLQRQERAARIDEVDAGQVILSGDLLRAQVLLHRHREVRAALDRRVVRDHDDFRALHAADTGDHAGGRCAAVVHAVRRERGQLEERRAGVEEGAHAIARQKLAALRVLAPRVFAAALGRNRHALLQLVGERAHVGSVGVKGLGARIHPRRNHAVASKISRPISMRRISLVPAPISYSLASRSSRPAGKSLM